MWLFFRRAIVRDTCFIYTRKRLRSPYYRFVGERFFTALDKDMPYIRVSLRTRGLCDHCFAYRDSLRTKPDCSVAKKAENWHAHLDAALATRVVYCRSQRIATGIARSVSSRIEMAALSYYSARQLSIPMLSEQTMNEWFAEKRDMMWAFSGWWTKG